MTGKVMHFGSRKSRNLIDCVEAVVVGEMEIVEASGVGEQTMVVDLTAT
jgi:hypothetical protein